MTDEELKQRFATIPIVMVVESPLRDYIVMLAQISREARRQALHAAADDFEAGATPDDIRANAERLE